MVRKLQVAIFAIVLSVGTSLIGAAPASAYALLTCKFGGTDLYWRPFNNELATSIATGVATGAWNNTATPIDFIYTITATDPHIAVWDYGTYGDVWWAQVLPLDGDTTCSDSGGIWESSEVAIEVDLYNTFSLTQYQLNLVIMHEFGHAQGLAHSTSTCNPSNTNQKVMSQGTDKFYCTGTAPWPDDVAGVNAIY